MSDLFDYLDNSQTESEEQEESFEEEEEEEEQDQIKEQFDGVMERLQQDSTYAQTMCDEVFQRIPLQLIGNLSGYYYQITKLVNQEGQLDIQTEWNVPKFSDSVQLKNLMNRQEIQKQNVSKNVLTMEQLEDILNKPCSDQIQSSSAQLAQHLLIPDTENNIRNHPLYSHIIDQQNTRIVQDQIEEDEIIFVQPPRARQQNFAIKDKENLDFDQLLINPPIQYNFNLDPFQKRAAYRILQRQNVFVAAHTSAGKTLVAEWAIATCKARKSRVIYTSPIKALSNQKFYDFKRLFTDVGIITGDVQVNPEAFCLIMTTEILRSMLYNNSAKIRDLEWVILDEVHYVNDAERGMVWEEVLIMLPSYVKLVMLSATVPNAEQFSEWAGRIRKQKIYLQTTFHRPVPLEHMVYFNEQFYIIINQDSTLNKGNLNRLEQDKREAKDGNTDRGRRRGSRRGQQQKRGKSEKVQYRDLIRNMAENEMLPCVIFEFARVKCDDKAQMLSQQIDLLDHNQKAKVKGFIKRSLKRISKQDREIPQIQIISKLLEKGIGVHHSGVLPILKEIVEILFAKQLTKILVATETVAMGLNLPARSVIFGSIRKFDGDSNRYLEPGEYTQMSGRAGRRGKDTKGNVIIFFPDHHSVLYRNQLEKVIKNKPLELESKFKMRYSQITSLMMTESINIEEMAQKSFKYNETFQEKKEIQASLPQEQQRLLQLEQQMQDCEGAQEFEQKFSKLQSLQNQLQLPIEKNKLKPGLVIEVKQDSQNAAAILTNVNQGILQAFLWKPNGLIENVQVPQANIIGVYETDIRFQTNIDYTKGSNQQEFHLKMQELTQNGILKSVAKLCKPRDIKNKQSTIKEVETLLQELQHNQLWRDPNRESVINTIKQYNLQSDKIKEKQQSYQKISSAMHDLEQRIQIMKEYALINDQKQVQTKGRVAALFNNPYSLVITQAIYDALFIPLTANETAAVVCCFVCDFKVDYQIQSESSELHKALAQLTIWATQLYEIESKCQIDQSFKDGELQVGLVDIVLSWTEGISFKEIMDNFSHVREGNIVRSIIRTHELLKSMSVAACITGQVELKKKFSEAAALLKRDIAFAASLYIS